MSCWQTALQQLRDEVTTGQSSSSSTRRVSMYRYTGVSFDKNNKLRAEGRSSLSSWADDAIEVV